MSRKWGSRPRAQRLVEFEGRVGHARRRTVIQLCEIRDSFLGRAVDRSAEKAATVVTLLASDYIVVAASASAGTAPCTLHARPAPPLSKVRTLPSANAADSHGSIPTLRPARELVPPPTTRPRATTRTGCGSESRRRRDGVCQGARAHRRDRREPGYMDVPHQRCTFCSSAAFEAWFRGSSGGDERRSRRRGAPLRRRRDPREAGRDAPRRGVAGGAAGGVEGRGPAPHRTSPAPPRFYDRPAPACATTDDAARDASRSRAACCAHALKGRTGRYNKSHGIVNSRHPPISRTPRLQGRGVLATSC